MPEEEVPVRRVGRLVLDRVVDNFFAETEQVAFCTQNVVAGIDFTDDPLLQGRNFSYLDTQLKRLGSPNFTYLPVDPPKCPFAHFQQDGHIAMPTRPAAPTTSPTRGRPRSAGPGKTRTGGFTTTPSETPGPKRGWAESFADHYSQARQFFVSQTDVEQQHIIDAFVFGLGKCAGLNIRTRMVAGLRNVDDELAQAVADGLGLAELPDAVEAARPPITDLAPSSALSILSNGPADFAGRKLGILLTDGFDPALLETLQAAAKTAKVTTELVAPKVGGIDPADGTHHSADQKLDGAPSVLYDAVALVVPRTARSNSPAARQPGTS